MKSRQTPSIILQIRLTSYILHENIFFKYEIMFMYCLTTNVSSDITHQVPIYEKQKNYSTTTSYYLFLHCH